MNVVYALGAYPFGRLSDTMNHSKLLAWGLAVLIAADLILAFSDSLSIVFVGIAFWGLHLGMTQGLFATMVADAAPTDLRGTAFGFFNLLSGFTMLVASVLAGLLWDRLGPAFTFSAGALFCGLALVGIALMPQVGLRVAGGLRSDQE
jgi:MFS family permease